MNSRCTTRPTAAAWIPSRSTPPIVSIPIGGRSLPMQPAQQQAPPLPFSAPAPAGLPFIHLLPDILAEIRALRSHLGFFHPTVVMMDAALQTEDSASKLDVGVLTDAEIPPPQEPSPTKEATPVTKKKRTGTGEGRAKKAKI